MKKFFSLIVLMLLLVPVIAYGATPSEEACKAIGGTFTRTATGGECTPPAGTLSISGALEKISTTLIFIVGAISVIMIIVGGLKYVLSMGDASSIKGAKDTVLYAVVGLVVAVLGYAIVSFVTTRVG